MKTGRFFLLVIFLSCLQQILIVNAQTSCGQISDCASCASHITGDLRCHYCQRSSSCLDSRTSGSCSSNELITDPYDCPIPPQNGFEYNDGFARGKVLPLCGAAYDDNPVSCLASHGYRLYRQLLVNCDSSQSDTCSAFTAVDDSDRAIVIAFRGTSRQWQLIMEGTGTLFENKKAFAIGGKVDAYFYDAFYSLWNGGLQADLNALKSQYPNYELWVVGHSLGGAMASLCASLIVHSNIYAGNRVKLLTLGQPRTGDIAYCQAHDQLLPYSYRVVHRHDLIAHLPPKIPFNWFDTPYHHRYEVWYNNDMSSADYRVCTRADDDTCSNTQIDLSIDDHTHYFNGNVECR
jgi:hypothetical protein